MKSVLVVEVLDHPEDMSQRAAALVLDALRDTSARTQGRDVNLCFSAGSTPIRTYEILAERRAEADWDRVRLFQMDEFLHPATAFGFGSYLEAKVVRPLGLRSVELLPAPPAWQDAAEWNRRIVEHERKIDDAGGLDLVLHGVGVNGHLGFNEPGSEPDSDGRVVELAAVTRASSPHPDEKPSHGVTVGLRRLLAGRRTILLAAGRQKARAVSAAVDGRVSRECPASLLRTLASVTILLDRDAAAVLALDGRPAAGFDQLE
ncbi:MAG: nagB [Frankiales bacterium]|nr:nagB [Frankiales bacterium]